MASKESLVTALINDSLVSGWLTRTVNLGDLSDPGTLEESAKTIAQYCVNCNEILKLFNDVPLLDFLLRGMQRNPAIVSLVLSGLEKKPDDPI